MLVTICVNFEFFVVVIPSYTFSVFRAIFGLGAVIDDGGKSMAL